MRQLRRTDAFKCISIILLTTSLVSSAPIDPKSPSNPEILSRLGLTKLRVSPNHHRKRLAVESRHHQSSDDSHMYVIKLPPNPYYYVNNRPNKQNVNAVPSSGKKLPVGFKSNGKPGKVYHWNIPVLKKMVTSHARSRLDDSMMHKIQKLPMKNYEMFANEVHDKISNVNRKYQKSPTYYAPGKPKKGNFHKVFPGNGKPHSFYVIEKSKKAQYHRLLP